jgi:quercetin dioxygenase-like cupin family protein
MTRYFFAALAGLAVIVGTSTGAVSSQTRPQGPTGISRTELQRHDLGIAGHEAIQVRVDFAPGAAFPRHRHPGEEIIYVLSGTIEYRVEGRAAVTLRAGDVLFVPADTTHAAANVGSDNASELATYIVDKARPLVTLVD